MSNIRLLQDITVYNSITAISGINVNALTVNDKASVANSLVIGASANPDASKKLYVAGNMFVDGTIMATGSSILTNTYVTTTSALSVSNSGTGAALTVEQSGNHPVAIFFNSANNPALFIDSNGYVGVGTNTPNANLTVVGDISASGNIYGASTIKKFVSSFGNGSDKNYILNHNLGVEDVVVSIVDTSTKEVVYPLVTYSALNQVTIGFSVAPALTAYKAIILG
jgi:hypothetical protein